MSKFLMLGNYTSHATMGISKARTKQVDSLIKENGGEMLEISGLLGAYDIYIRATFPSNEVAIRCSLALTKLTGITFSSFPAVEVVDFDDLVADI